MSGFPPPLPPLLFRKTPEQQWNQVVQMISLRMGYGGEVSDVQISNLEDLVHPFRLSWACTRKKAGYWDSQKMMLPLPPFGIEGNTEASGQKQEPPELYRDIRRIDPGFKAAAIRQNLVDVLNTTGGRGEAGKLQQAEKD
jgi:ribosomal protein S28E/S33